MLPTPSRALSGLLLASSAGGLARMAAAVIKLIGPDMPTSGLHVSLETVVKAFQNVASLKMDR